MKTLPKVGDIIHTLSSGIKGARVTKVCDTEIRFEYINTGGGAWASPREYQDDERYYVIKHADSLDELYTRHPGLREVVEAYINPKLSSLLLGDKFTVEGSSLTYTKVGDSLGNVYGQSGNYVTKFTPNQLVTRG